MKRVTANFERDYENNRRGYFTNGVDLLQIDLILKGNSLWPLHSGKLEPTTVEPTTDDDKKNYWIMSRFDSYWF